MWKHWYRCGWLCCCNTGVYTGYKPHPGRTRVSSQLNPPQRNKRPRPFSKRLPFRYLETSHSLWAASSTKLAFCAIGWFVVQLDGLSFSRSRLSTSKTVHARILPLSNHSSQDQTKATAKPSNAPQPIDQNTTTIRSLLRVKLTKRMKEAPGSIVAVGGADIFGPHIDDAKSHLGGTMVAKMVESPCGQSRKHCTRSPGRRMRSCHGFGLAPNGLTLS